MPIRICNAILQTYNDCGGNNWWYLADGYPLQHIATQQAYLDDYTPILNRFGHDGWELTRLRATLGGHGYGTYDCRTACFQQTSAELPTWQYAMVIIDEHVVVYHSPLLFTTNTSTGQACRGPVASYGWTLAYVVTNQFAWPDTKEMIMKRICPAGNKNTYTSSERNQLPDEHLPGKHP